MADDLIPMEFRRKRGRPKKVQPSGPESPRVPIGHLSEEDAILCVYSLGGLDAEVCKYLKITRAEFDRKAKDAKFKRLIDYGRALSEAWWVEEGRKGLKDKTFNAALWTMFMKSVFNWNDKSAATITNVIAGNESREELLQRASELGIAEFLKEKRAS